MLHSYDDRAIKESSRVNVMLLITTICFKYTIRADR